MSKVKFQNYSGIKNAKDNPRCTCKTDLKNGVAVVYSVDSKGNEIVAMPTNAADAKKADRFVWNTIDKPELDNENDFVIKSGEFVRTFEFPKNEAMDISGDLVVTKTVNIGDVLVPRTVSTAAESTDVADGKYEVSSATGYKFGLKVLAKTTYGGKGYSCVVVEQ